MNKEPQLWLSGKQEKALIEKNQMFQRTLNIFC